MATTCDRGTRVRVRPVVCHATAVVYGAATAAPPARPKTSGGGPTAVGPVVPARRFYDPGYLPKAGPGTPVVCHRSLMLPRLPSEKALDGGCSVSGG